ncbi:MAG: hypothetical protein IPM07_25435 [Anaerolineales bacterium]|nr:hypothetical protein [Anaerolineales bacterium]
MSDLAAVQDWRDAALLEAHAKVVDTNMRMDVMQRELAEVVRERDALIIVLKGAELMLLADGKLRAADELRKIARQACPSYGDDDASQV